LFAQLRACGFTHIVGVPDNGSRALYELAWSDRAMEVVPVTREGEAMALASGLHIGGRLPLVVIQSTGMLEAGDALRGTAFNMGLPLVLLIGYRGYSSLEPGAERIDTAATFFEPTLRAWSLPYFTLLHTDDSQLIPVAMAHARAISLPVALAYAGEMV
jgi:sulfopyruvate decarboxylase TPP-binding subunit